RSATGVQQKARRGGSAGGRSGGTGRLLAVPETIDGADRVYGPRGQRSRHIQLSAVSVVDAVDGVARLRLGSDCRSAVGAAGRGSRTSSHSVAGWREPVHFAFIRSGCGRRGTCSAV